MQAESCGLQPLEEARWAAVGSLKRETTCCVLWAQPGSFVHFGRSQTESKQHVLGAGNRAQCQCPQAQKPNPAAALGPSPRPGQTVLVTMNTVHSWGSRHSHFSSDSHRVAQALWTSPSCNSLQAANDTHNAAGQRSQHVRAQHQDEDRPS